MGLLNQEEMPFNHDSYNIHDSCQQFTESLFGFFS